MPTLHLGERLLDELRTRCEAAHPSEACGLILGRWVPREGKGPKLVAEALHPARNVRSDARTQFELAPEDFVAADDAARRAGLEIVGTWHSHVEAPAEPSAADVAGAQDAWLSVIVSVSVADGGPPRATSWRCWSRSGAAMSEEKICVC